MKEKQKKGLGVIGKERIKCAVSGASASASASASVSESGDRYENVACLVTHEKDKQVGVRKRK